MRIAICDDEVLFREELKHFLLSYSKEHRILVEIVSFNNGAELLAHKKAFDVLFLDYAMPGDNGMTIARTLRANNALCSIIFVTSFPGFMQESFEVAPFRFLEKPVSQKNVYDVLDSYIHQQNSLAPILVCGKFGQRSIAFKDIVFIEGDGKHCTIHTASETIPCSKNLSKALSLLPFHCFVRTHKGFAANMYYIDHFKKDELFFSTGDKIYISRTYAASFRSAYASFIKDCFVRF